GRRHSAGHACCGTWRRSRTCAYDRAGLAWSEPARTPRTVARILAELRSILETATTWPAILVGHSFGAFLVCAYASEYPDDVAGVVLLDPPSEWHEITPQPYPPRTVTTGHCAVATTRAATLPRKNFVNPVRPCVPTTSRSTFFERAARTICLAGSPSATSAVVRIPPFVAFVVSLASSRFVHSWPCRSISSHVCVPMYCSG